MRRPTITGDDQPRPGTSCFQTTFFPSAHSIGNPVELERPWPVGPRNSGQSSWAAAERASIALKAQAAADAEKKTFIERLSARKNPQPFLDVEAFKSFEAERKAVQTRTEELQARRNALSKQIGALKGKGQHAEADAAMAEVNALKGELEASAARLEQIQHELTAMLQAVPNLPHDSVPAGSDEHGNVLLRQWGTPRAFDFAVKDHVDVGEPQSVLRAFGLGQQCGTGCRIDRFAGFGHALVGDALFLSLAGAVRVPQPPPVPKGPTVPSAAALLEQGIKVPALHLELHAYSDNPSERFVFINGRKYREGEHLPEGTQIVTVEPNGVVMSEQGHRFMLAPE